VTAADSVTATVEVAVDPDVAFAVFTGEIGAWYRRDRFTVLDVSRTVDIRFEPGVGGRLLDVYDPATGEGAEMGRVVVWEPGRRVVFTDNHATEVEVRFEAAGGGTRVTLEHRGFDRLPPAEADRVRRYGWPQVLGWFAGHLSRATPPAPPHEGDTTMDEAHTVKFLGLTPYLYYGDAVAALEWLARVFGFEEEVRYLDEDGTVAEAEMSAGDVRIMMAGRGPRDAEGTGQQLIVHVDDVDALYARVTAAGVEATPPEDKPYGPRLIAVTDPWGYQWSFWQQVRDDVELPDGWQEIRRESTT